jgi:plexin A
LDVDNLPIIANANYICVFTPEGSSKRLVVQASKPAGAVDKITCPTPDTAALPTLSNGAHSLRTTLSIQADAVGTEFAATNFTFYDCSTYTSCSACAQSAYQCDWCIETATCTHIAEDVCRAMHIVNGINVSAHSSHLSRTRISYLQRKGNSDRRGAGFCPQIKPIDQSSSVIYVAAGTTKEISVTAKNLLDVHRDFECIFTVEASTHRRRAVKDGDKLVVHNCAVTHL